ncbi:unnamed protein product [Lactuca saligna]|uniref:Uncharacterized protein n=1 Tax=Lactuca saligna TaxID=75948 RepID=A0AA35VB52_LACSI|nr:unnamed protein product [Lactuca saligna]
MKMFLAKVKRKSQRKEMIKETNLNLKMIIHNLKRKGQRRLMIKGLSREQKECVRAMGFGSLLQIMMIDVPLKIVYYIVDHFNFESLKVDFENCQVIVISKHVHDMLGLASDEKIRFLDDILQEEGGFGCGEINEPYVEEECQESDGDDEECDGKGAGIEADANDTALQDQNDKNDAQGKVDGPECDVNDHEHGEHISKINDLLNENDDDKNDDVVGKEILSVGLVDGVEADANDIQEGNENLVKCGINQKGS